MPYQNFPFIKMIIVEINRRKYWETNKNESLDECSMNVGRLTSGTLAFIDYTKSKTSLQNSS